MALSLHQAGVAFHQSRSGVCGHHGLLDLAEAPETALLRERLAADPVADIVFTAEEEAAYRNLVDRFTAMWSLSSPLARFLY